MCIPDLTADKWRFPRHTGMWVMFKWLLNLFKTCLWLRNHWLLGSKPGYYTSPQLLLRYIREFSLWSVSAVTQAEEPTKFMLADRGTYGNLDVDKLQLKAQRELGGQYRCFTRSVWHTDSSVRCSLCSSRRHDFTSGKILNSKELKSLQTNSETENSFGCSHMRREPHWWGMRVLPAWDWDDTVSFVTVKLQWIFLQIPLKHCLSQL